MRKRLRKKLGLKLLKALFNMTPPKLSNIDTSRPGWRYVKKEAKPLILDEFEVIRDGYK